MLLSAIFGAVHYFFKPMENWMDDLSVGLLGLLWCFTLTLQRTGSLWFAIGFHAMSDCADMGAVRAAEHRKQRSESYRTLAECFVPRARVACGRPSWNGGECIGISYPRHSVPRFCASLSEDHRLVPTFPISALERRSIGRIIPFPSL